MIQILFQSAIDFTIIQTVVMMIATSLFFYSAVTVYLRAPSVLLNRIFAIANVFLGLTPLSFVLSNIPVILWEENILIFVQLAYTCLLIGMIFFLISAIILEFGEEEPFKPLYLIAMGAIIVINLVVIWEIVFFENSIYYVALGDINTSIWFKIVYYGSVPLVYLLTFFLYLKTYMAGEGTAKENMRWFLMGWIIGGLALITSVLSDFFRPFDLINFLILALAAFVQRRAFIKKT
ncbi:MAG: hypothetical protein ACFFDI_00165 [Promethearchaeota archaeon]